MRNLYFSVPGHFLSYHLVLFSSLHLLLIHSGTVSVFPIFQHLNGIRLTVGPQCIFLCKTNLLIIYDSADFLLNIFFIKLSSSSVPVIFLLVSSPLFFRDYYHEINLNVLCHSFFVTVKYPLKMGLMTWSNCGGKQRVAICQKKLMFYDRAVSP